MVRQRKLRQWEEALNRKVRRGSGGEVIEDLPLHTTGTTLPLTTRGSARRHHRHITDTAHLDTLTATTRSVPFIPPLQ